MGIVLCGVVDSLHSLYQASYLWPHSFFALDGWTDDRMDNREDVVGLALNVYCDEGERSDDDEEIESILDARCCYSLRRWRTKYTVLIHP